MFQKRFFHKHTEKYGQLRIFFMKMVSNYLSRCTEYLIAYAVFPSLKFYLVLLRVLKVLEVEWCSIVMFSLSLLVLSVESNSLCQCVKHYFLPFQQYCRWSGTFEIYCFNQAFTLILAYLMQYDHCITFEIYCTHHLIVLTKYKKIPYSFLHE